MRGKRNLTVSKIACEFKTLLRHIYIDTKKIYYIRKSIKRDGFHKRSIS
jgi:hypothetical protein